MHSLLFSPLQRGQLILLSVCLFSFVPEKNPSANLQTACESPLAAACCRAPAPQNFNPKTYVPPKPSVHLQFLHDMQMIRRHAALEPRQLWDGTDRPADD